MSDNQRGRDTRAAVRDLAELGLCVSEIAGSLGISARHVKRVLTEAGIREPGKKNQPVPKCTIAAMAQLIEDGCSFREVARTVGVRWETVAQHFPGQQWTKAQAASHGQLLRSVDLP